MQSPLIALALSLALTLSSYAATDEKITIAPGLALEVPQPWKATHDTRTTFLLEHFKEGNVLDASITIQVEKRANHDEAVRRLAQIEVESPVKPEYSLVSGWPALVRKSLEPFQYPGEQEKGEGPWRHPSGEKSWQVTIALAIEDHVVKLRALLQPGADPSLSNQALAIAQTLSAPAANRDQSDSDLRILRNGTFKPKVLLPKSHAPAASAGNAARALESATVSGASRRRLPGGGGAALKVAGAGEIEATSSTSGGDIVTDAACSISYSTNGGTSFTSSSITGKPSGLDGDCTVTWGPSGNFYLGQLGTDLVAFYKSASPSDGATFSYVTNAVDRTSLGINVDQPHITADRWNTSSSSGDFVYVSWQETGSFLSRVACSSNSGSAWSAPVDANSGNFGYPRVSVGLDGMVYVASRSWPSSIVLDKFSNCDSGLTEQPGFPVTIAINDIPCPVPGLDRCNNGNTLTSPTIAVDDTSASHVYVGWAQENGGGTGADIMIADSINGGQSFGSSIAANVATTGVRFMPWVNSWGGTAYVGWYDRSSAGTTTSDPNDFTRYHYGSVIGANGTLTPGPDFDLMGVDDPQCKSGWPCGARSTNDYTSCTIPSGGSLGSGCPKYGDYNGLTTGSGLLLNIWASGTAPSSLPPASSNNIHAYTVVTPLAPDFFVRDWTTGPGVTNHDGGVEPSTDPDFYSSSDVWNQVSSTPYSPVNDWVVGDSAVRGSTNYAFARVSRRAGAASTAASASVTVDFLQADFGLGVPFVDLGTEKVTLTATDLSQITPAHSWTVSPTASTHVCLAVQITTPDGPYLPPSLVGLSPGPSGSDPLIREDNKKAQRNLATIAGMGGSGGAGFEYYGIVHNIERFQRDIEIAYRLDPQAAKSMRGGTITVIGGPTVELTPAGHFVLNSMAPGEDRWIRVTFGDVSGDNGSLAEVRFNEVDEGKPVNGFAIGYRREPLALVRREVLQMEADVLGRLFAIAKDSEAGQHTAEAVRLLNESPQGLESQPFRAFRAGIQDALPAIIKRQFQGETAADFFGLQEALATLLQVQVADEERALVADEVLMQRLDAHLTQVRNRMRK
jgi:hypothetical protein